ncbi:L,D-transpeptidase family protein [Pectobacterium brasiliense]|uniref:L,D-transpeptidase family protein n=1 Tax=Pectobacterium TaxID=122277 RepID=UPI000500E2EB|nr:MULTISPECIES: L,D-transpeptidase family protein [Pectobacterium]KGA22713.1 L,D-transpeptidase [Pectobacterium brasiliense]KRF65641.1 L,D-transpeptidase [Pectobacterium brasiliense]MBN3185587.1 L,D-transpeptidase family protein [Pectobacterium brasiliense]MCL6328330.1 L,D-transpeptidase [Pectobacterium carotovorum subsp. carotovorum]MCL6379487.1 L,D-transpeptidase [Pectobacterium brasiliense]
MIGILSISNTAMGVSYELPGNGGRLVGETLTITTPDNNIKSLEFFAAKYQQGLSNMLEANPGVDVLLPKSGIELKVPQKLILPDTIREGIVINVAEMRLYYYPKGSNTVEVLPIGIGQAGRDTPTNWVTSVKYKKEGPTWTPTAATHRDYARRGESLPAFFPAGPENPMGLYAIYIGNLYAIHGTNANFGIGLRISQGCVRLRNDDIKYLFENVPNGTRVQFINEPIKVSLEPDGTHWIEVHEPLSRTRQEFESNIKIPTSLNKKVNAFINESNIDSVISDREIERRSGIPTRVK